MNRVVLATADAGFEERVRNAFNSKLNGELKRWLDADVLVGDPKLTTQELLRFDSELVVFGPDIDANDALMIAKQFDLHHPEVSVLLVAESTPQLLEQALRAGVRGILAPEASDADLRREFMAAAAVARERRARIPTAPAAGERSKPGSVITVLAPKGGSGKTLLSSNLAVTLAAAFPGEVALVDLDLQFGDITNALGLVPTHSMGDLAQSVGDIDAATVKVFLTPRGDNLFVLCAPDNPAQGERITPERVEQAIGHLAREFRFVIIDTAAGLSEHTLSALELSTDFVLVCDLAVASVRGLRKVLGALDQLEMSKQRRHVVLNRADSNVGLNTAEVASTIGRSIDVKVSSARSVPLSMNQGVPIVEAAPRSPVAKQMHELAGLFAELPAAKKGRRR
jgi:pilus assembly protein CpaE